MRRADSHTVLTSRPPQSASARLLRRAPRPASRRRVALRLLVRCDARCVRPTSAFSRSSYEHPRLAGSHQALRLRAGVTGRSPVSRQCDSLRWAARLVWVSPRRALSSLRDACGPYLWHPCRFSRGVSPPAGDRRDRARPDRVNDASRTAIRDAFHRTRTSAPRRPLERPARAFPGFAAWPPRLRLSSPLHPRRSLRTIRGPGSRPRAPLPTGGRASLSLGDACRLLQPETTRGHTQRAFDPHTREELSLRRRHQPMPVALAARCVAAPRPASRDLARAGLSHGGLRLRGRGRSRAEAFEQRRMPRALGRCRACPSRDAPGTRVASSASGEPWRSPSRTALA